MIKAIVFDAYGTLLNIPSPAHPYKELLCELFGTLKDSHKNVIMTTPMGLSGVCALFGTPPPDNMADIELKLHYEIDSIQLYPDVLEVLDKLRTEGFKIGVCSNLALPYGAPVKMLLGARVDHYTLSYEVGVVKPDKAIYQHVVDSFGLEPQEILFVGDTDRTDLQGPKQFGMHSRLVNRGKYRYRRPASLMTVIAAAKFINRF